MYLSIEAKKALESILTKSIEDVSRMDLNEEIKFVESKTGKPLIFSKKRDMRFVGRGNPLIVRRRIFTMHDVDRRLEKLK